MKQTRTKSGQLRESVTAEEFVRIWQSSHSLAEAAQKSGISVKGVAHRAARFKAKGIPLKHMRTDAKALDVKKLSKLAKDLAPKESA